MKKNDLLNLLKQDFQPMRIDGRQLFIEEPPRIVKDIIERIKKEEGITYAEAYGLLQLTKEYLEYEANYLSPIFAKKESE